MKLILIDVHRIIYTFPDYILLIDLLRMLAKSYGKNVNFIVNNNNMGSIHEFHRLPTSPLLRGQRTPPFFCRPGDLLNR